MTRLLVVDDEAMLRTALVAVFASAGFEVDAVERGDQVIAAVAASNPDVVVLDIHLPGRDGIDLAAEIAARPGAPRVILLTAVGRPAPISRALASPINGLLLKSSTADELVAAVQTVVAGGHVVDDELVRIAAEAQPDLTEREREILLASASGAPVDEVAARMFLAPSTVRNHLTSILAKTATRNRFEAVARAQELGML